LLQFNKQRHETTIRHNLRRLYGVAPCDTTLREICDEVNPADLRGASTDLITAEQQGLERLSVF